MSTDEQGPVPLSDWYCGAFQPSDVAPVGAYRCTMPAGHEGEHKAFVRGETRATWAHAFDRDRPCYCHCPLCGLAAHDYRCGVTP